MTFRTIIQTAVLALFGTSLLVITGCGGQKQTETAANSSDPSLSISRPVILGIVADDRIDEASGMVASRRFPGVFWMHNDSGGEPRVFAISSEGDSLGALTLAGADNEDFEDIAWGTGPTEGEPYLYVADMGDNDAERHHIVIYRVAEPTSLPSFISDKVETFRFRYPDGPRDAETLLIDPVTGDLTIVSKREDQVRVYNTPAPFTTQGITELTYQHTIPFTWIVGGDISPDGSFILIKDYEHIYGFHRSEGQSVADALAGQAIPMPYVEEPQGEAVAFTLAGTSYVTVSEEDDGIAAALAMYPFRPPANSTKPSE